MAISRSSTPRVIKFGKLTLTDLNPDAPVAEVVKMHATSRPELVNAQITGPTLEDGKNVYDVNVKATYKG